MTPCIFLPAHAEALGIPTTGLPVDLADPVACATWFLLVDNDHVRKLVPCPSGAGNFIWLGALIAAAQSGTLKLPDLGGREPVPQRWTFGGVEFERDPDLLGAGWMVPAEVQDCAMWIEARKHASRWIPVRPANIRPPRVELVKGDVLEVVGDEKPHPLYASGVSQGRECLVDFCGGDVALVRRGQVLTWIARETIDRAFAAGELKVRSKCPTT